MTEIKKQLHPRNKHNTRYNFDQLIATYPTLKQYVTENKYKSLSIDFSNPNAVMALNKAILMDTYGITYWDIPKKYLCPPIPGRADYVHYVADVLAKSNSGSIPTGAKITCLDVGIGANCIYPIIGCKEYGWEFIGSDMDADALESANEIIQNNQYLQGKIDLRFQFNKAYIFKNIIEKTDKIDVTVCNPPFHASEQEANKANIRKNSNLLKVKSAPVNQNFGGKNNELWYEGGERNFIKKMLKESKDYGKQCYWFTTLVSKEANLIPLTKTLQKYQPTKVLTIPMAQGNKISRFLAWTFLTEQEQEKWIAQRWS